MIPPPMSIFASEARAQQAAGEIPGDFDEDRQKGDHDHSHRIQPIHGTTTHTASSRLKFTASLTRATLYNPNSAIRVSTISPT